MHIQSIQNINLNSYKTNLTTQNTPSRVTNAATDVFVKNTQPSFTGPYQYFEKALLKEINSGASFESFYWDLLRSVKYQSALKFHSGSDFISNGSVHQILNDLRCPAPWGFENVLVRGAENADLPVITIYDRPLISIRNNGPHGLIDAIAGNDRVVDARVVFHDPSDITKTIEFGTDKDGDYLLERPYDLLTFWDNGNQKMVKNFSGDYQSSDTTYYNRDGSESFWKNLFG